MWSECKELWTEGPREYILQLWNVLDFGMLSIFIAAFTARFFAFLQAMKAQEYVDENIQAPDLSLVTLPPDIKYFTYGKSERETGGKERKAEVKKSPYSALIVEEGGKKT